MSTKPQLIFKPIGKKEMLAVNPGFCVPAGGQPGSLPAPGDACPIFKASSLDGFSPCPWSHLSDPFV